MHKPLEIAVYGKGGIGKSTMSANVSMALAMQGSRVLQIGCDPKHDSTRLLMHGKEMQTVLDYLRDHDKYQGELKDVLHTGALGVGCVEAGGPRPGVGCAGRGIISSFEFLELHHAKERYDHVIYDVLGDVVCGGFAVPVRREYADAIFLVTSGEYMALYAANNILRGIYNVDGENHRRVAGIIFNERKLADESRRVNAFAAAVGLPIVARIPRSEWFSRAEQNKCTIMELDDCESEQQIFLKLADRIQNGLALYPAKPVTDEELEDVVLSVNRMTGKSERKSERWEQEQRLSECGSAGKPISDCGEEGKYKQSSEDSLKKQGGAAKKRPPLYGCAFNGAATTAVHLTDARIIAHAPRSCAFFTWQNISSSGRKNLFNRGILMPSAISPNFSCTEIGQREAIFGGIDKLREAVIRAGKDRPGAIIVISSCVSGIIGDDIRNLEELSTDEVPVITIEADGVIGGDYMEGIRMALIRIAERLIDPSVSPRGRMVNLIHETGVSNNAEVNYRIIRDLLSRMDIQINARFLGDASCRDMKNFLAARVNILAEDSPDGQMLRQWLEERYGCRFIRSCFPIGFRETKRWLEEIGTEFKCAERIPDIVREEERKYREEIEYLRPHLQGKKLLMTTINRNMDWLLETVDDLEMEVTWIGVLNYLRQPLHISNQERYQKITEEYLDVERINQKIRETGPDIVVGNDTSMVEEGNYLIDTLGMTQVAGFRSGLDVINRWMELLEKKEMQDGKHRMKKGGWQDDRELFEQIYG